MQPTIRVHQDWDQLKEAVELRKPWRVPHRTLSCDAGEGEAASPAAEEEGSRHCWWRRRMKAESSGSISQVSLGVERRRRCERIAPAWRSSMVRTDLGERIASSLRGRWSWGGGGTPPPQESRDPGVEVDWWRKGLFFFFFFFLSSFEKQQRWKIKCENLEIFPLFWFVFIGKDQMGWGGTVLSATCPVRCPKAPAGPTNLRVQKKEPAVSSHHGTHVSA